MNLHCYFYNVTLLQCTFNVETKNVFFSILLRINLAHSVMGLKILHEKVYKMFLNTAHFKWCPILIRCFLQNVCLPFR